MAFNTILSPVPLSNSGLVFGDLPNITALSDGSFAVTYADLSSTNSVIWQVFNAQGQGVAGGPAMPQTSPQLELFSDVAALSGGGYALAWEESVIVGANFIPTIYTAVYDSQGNQLSTPIAASGGIGQSAFPDVIALPDGGYVVAWDLADNADVAMAILGSAGQQITGPIKLTNSPGIDDHLALGASLALSNGNIVLTWTSGNAFSDHDIYTAIFDAQGQPVLPPTNITNTSDIDDADVDAAALANGNYALFWTGLTQSPFQTLAYLAVYDAQGNQLKAPAVVGSGQYTSITALTDGNYALSWIDGDLFTAVYNEQGELVSGPVNVSNTAALGEQADEITALSNGAYALTWQGQIDDGSWDIFTAIYSAQGQQLVAPVNVSNSPGVDDVFARVAAGANGSYAITWEASSSPYYNEYLAIFQYTDSGTPGDVSYVNVPDITLDLSALVDVGGNVIISDNQNLVTLDLHNLVSVGGSFVVSNNGALLTLTLPSLASVGGDLIIDNNVSAGVIDVGATSVGGDLTIDNNASATEIDVSATSVGGHLTIDNNASASVIDVSANSVGGDLAIDDNASATEINVSANSVGGNLDLSGNTSVITIDLSALAQAGALIIANNGVVTFNLSALVSVGGIVSVTDNDSLLTVDMPNLTDIAGDLTVSGNDAAAAMSFGNLTSVGGAVALSMGDGSVRTIEAGQLQTVGGGLTVSMGDGSVRTVEAGQLHTVGGDIAVSIGDGSSNTIDFGSLDSVDGDVSIALGNGATAVDASKIGADGGVLTFTGASSNTTVTLGSLDNMDGTLTVTSADGVSLASDAGLATIVLTGTATDNTLIGSTTSANVIDAGDGNDSVTGGDANDVIAAGGGGDTMVGGHGGGDDVYDGGAGTDTATFRSATHAITVDLNESDRAAHATFGGSTLGQLLTNAGIPESSPVGLAEGIDIGTDALIGIENVVGGQAGDTLSGNVLDNVITGGAGDDTLDGRGGTDTAVYSGTFASYSVVRHADGSLTVTDIRANSPDGTDALRDFELFQFADGVRTLAAILPPPVITSNGGGDGAQVSIVENATAVAQVTATNPNAVQNLEFTIAGGADAAKFQIDAATGALAFIALPDFEHATDAGGNNVYDVIVQVSDGFHFDTQALAVSVADANEAPVLVSQTAGQSATAGTPFALTLPATTFQDPDAGDHLTLAATRANGAALPAWLTFNPTTGAFSGTPGAGDAGGFDVKVTATDTSGLSAADVFHFSVSAPSTNHAPVIGSDLGGSIASVIITDDTRYVATVHATDPDPGTSITYSIVGGADRKLFTIDPRTGVLSFKTTPHDGQSYQVTVAASDGTLQDTQAIKVQVAIGPFEFGNNGVADTFVFKPHFGLAVVSNFDATSTSHDVLELDHTLFRNADPNSSPAAILDLIEDHSFQLGHDVVIVTDTHDIIDLRNTNLHSLTASDFLLV